MGGALWWLLAAAVSGSWLMLLALVLSLAAWAVFPAAVCGGWVSQSRDRKKKTLVRLGLAVEHFRNLGYTLDAHNLIFPIPQNQIEIVNNPSILWQNPGF